MTTTVTVKISSLAEGEGSCLQPAAKKSGLFFSNLAASPYTFRTFSPSLRKI